MGCAVAAAAVLSLVAAATADLELGIRGEGRSSVLAASGLRSEPRATVSTSPTATVLLDGSALRLKGGYAAQIWTSDVGAMRSPGVTHNVEARLATRADEPWLGEATVSATRGKTEPLTDAARVAAGKAGAQVATTEPLTTEALQTVGRVEWKLGSTTLAGAAGWHVSRGVDDAAQRILPLQQGVGVDAAVTRAVTERDALSLKLGGTQTFTDTAGGTISSTSSTATGTWRRRLSEEADGWLGAGATLAREDSPSGTVEVVPAAEAGFVRFGEALAVEVSARLSTFVDRFTGEVSPMAYGACTLRWAAREHLSLGGSASGGARTDGETGFAALDLHATWAVGQRTRMETGVLGRWQLERRPENPSFFEGGVFLAVSYGTGSLLGRAP
jgi:hypothetical protein